MSKSDKYQCFSCGEIFTAEQWNTATNEEYPLNIAKLPENYVPNNHTRETVGLEESNINLPAFVCPKCDSKPMADELIKINE